MCRATILYDYCSLETWFYCSAYAMLQTATLLLFPPETGFLTSHPQSPAQAFITSLCFTTSKFQKSFTAEDACRTIV